MTYVFNTSTIVLIYQQREGTVFVGTISCLLIVLSLYLVGDYMKGVLYLKLTFIHTFLLSKVYKNEWQH